MKNSHEGTKARSSDCRAILLAGGGLILAAWAAYHNSFVGPFIYDDSASITDNPTIRHLWAIGQVLSPPHQEGITVGGRPLFNLSLAINHAFSGTAVRGYHALNLAIHVLAGLTLLGIVRRTLLQPALRTRFDAGSLACGIAVALLWTLHPLQTEAVTYVVQRAESLMGLFYLLTLYCFIRGTESPAPPQSRGWALGLFDSMVGRSLRDLHRYRVEHGGLGETSLPQTANQIPKKTGALGWHLLAVAACLAGMATKEVMVSAPLIVLLYDRTFVSGTFREAWRRHGRLYLGLAGTWLLLGYLVASTGGNRGGSIGLGVGVAWWDYGLTQFRAIVRYLWLSVWPHPLVLDYGTYWIKRAAEVVPSALIVVPLVAGTLIGLRRWPVLGFIGGWFFVILAPTCLVPGTTQMIVEHRMYLPLAALVTPAVLGIHALAGRRSLVLFLALAAGLGLLTSRRNEDYRSDLAIWGDTVAKCPGNAYAHNNLGYALAEAGRVPEAMEHYEEALRIIPDYPKAHNNLGNALVPLGRVEEAIRHYGETLRVTPDYAQAHNNLGNALVQAGRMTEALDQYATAVRLKSDYADAHNNLGLALVKAGRVSEAIQHYEEALRINPGYAEAHNNLGIALAQTGRMPEAIEHYAEALRIDPNFIKAHNNLGSALVQLDRMPEAMKQYEEALRIKPDYAEAHYNLGVILAQAGRVAEAIGHYEKSLRTRPGSAMAHNAFGLALAQAGRRDEAIKQYEEALRIKPGYAEARNNLEMARRQTAPPAAGSGH